MAHRYDIFLLSVALCLYALFLFLIDVREDLILGGIFLLCGTGILALVVLAGRKVKKIKHSPVTRDDAVETHKNYISLFLYYVSIGVVSIEVGVRRMGGLEGDVLLLILHFILVFSASISFITAYYFLSGNQSPVHHAKVAYTFVASYVMVSVTGTLLLLELLHDHI